MERGGHLDREALEGTQRPRQQTWDCGVEKVREEEKDRRIQARKIMGPFPRLPPTQEKRRNLRAPGSAARAHPGISRGWCFPRRLIIILSPPEGLLATQQEQFLRLMPWGLEGLHKNLSGKGYAIAATSAGSLKKQQV